MNVLARTNIILSSSLRIDSDSKREQRSVFHWFRIVGFAFHVAAVTTYRERQIVVIEGETKHFQQNRAFPT
jgi:hypothetical protein